METEKTGTPVDRRVMLLGVVVLLGAVLGTVLYPRWPALQALMGQAPVTFWTALLPDLCLFLLLLLCGTLSRGPLLVLLSVFLKGFLLSAASWVVLTGEDGGFLLSLCGLLLPGSTALGSLILLGRQALGRAIRRGKLLRPDNAWLFSCAICLGLILLSALLQSRLSPLLCHAVRTFLTHT